MSDDIRDPLRLIQELFAENARLNNKRGDLIDERAGLIAENRQLRAENEKLKVSADPAVTPERTRALDLLSAENAELHAENEKLKVQLAEVRDHAESATAANCRTIHEQRLMIERLKTK